MGEQFYWSSKEGEMGTVDAPEKNFLRWCNELQHFTDKEWARVYKRIAGDKKQAARMGENLYPPSSLDVVAYAEPQNARLYKSFDRSTALEDITAKEKRKELGRAECAKLLEMFD